MRYIVGMCLSVYVKHVNEFVGNACRSSSYPRSAIMALPLSINTYLEPVVVVLPSEETYNNIIYCAASKVTQK